MVFWSSEITHFSANSGARSKFLSYLISLLKIFPAMADEAESPAIIEIRLLGSPDIASMSVPPFSLLKVPS